MYKEYRTVCSFCNSTVLYPLSLGIHTVYLCHIKVFEMTWSGTFVIWICTMHVYILYWAECCVRVYICAWCRLVQAPVRNLRHISHANADLLTCHRMGCWAGLHEVKCHWWGRGRRRAILTGNGWNRGKCDWCVGQEVQQRLFSVH